MDYIVDHNALQPILDRIRLGGWVVEGWTQQGGPSIRNWWDAGLIQLRRSYRVRITRTPEHQALVEKRREVAAGDNTYLTVKTEFVRRSLNARGGPGRSEVVGNIIEALALAVLHPDIQRPRPTAREGDLT